MSRITSVAELRSLIGEPVPGLEDKNIDRLDEFSLKFLAASPFMVLSTSDSAGRVDASPKGDAAGFVLAEDANTLLIPERPGNKLAYGLQNILQNPQVGCLFMIPNTPETLRVNGRAELVTGPALLEKLSARGKPAVLAIKVEVEECFFHCAKAFIRSGLWKPEGWGDRHKVSFGEIFAARQGLDETVAKMVDEAVEADYQTNL